jgi:hypothetical protein
MHPKLLESTVAQCRAYIEAADCHGDAPAVERLIEAVVQLAAAPEQRRPLPQIELDSLLEHIYENGIMAEGVMELARALCEAYARDAKMLGEPTSKDSDKTCTECEGTGRYGDGKHDGSGRWIDCPFCTAVVPGLDPAAFFTKNAMPKGKWLLVAPRGRVWESEEIGSIARAAALEALRVTPPFSPFMFGDESDKAGVDLPAQPNRKRPAAGATLPLPKAGPTGAGGWCEMCGVTHEGPHPPAGVTVPGHQVTPESDQAGDRGVVTPCEVCSDKLTESDSCESSPASPALTERMEQPQ